MHELDRIVRRVAQDLAALRVKWALVGGLAVSARTKPRFTRDIDVAVAVPDEAASERLVRDLILGRAYSLDWELTGPLGRLIGVRLVPESEQDEPPVVDLLFGSTGIEADIVAAASELSLGTDLVAPVAALGHLLAMKLLSVHPERRPQDLVDIQALVLAASDEEIARARQAVHAITSRGAHRGKDLARELEAALVRYRTP